MKLTRGKIEKQLHLLKHGSFDVHGINYTIQQPIPDAFKESELCKLTEQLIKEYYDKSKQHVETKETNLDRYFYKLLNRGIYKVYKEVNNVETNCDTTYCSLCKECILKKDIKNWLLSEYEEYIELTVFEYHLLKAIVDEFSSETEFDKNEILRSLKFKGHFSGVVDTSVKIGEILSNFKLIEKIDRNE